MTATVAPATIRSGALAFLGLLGVGGGNIVVPALVLLGIAAHLAWGLL